MARTVTFSIKNLIAAALLLSALGSFGIYYYKFREVPSPYPGDAAMHQHSLFRIYPARDSMIVMFGNSITEGAAWNELLNRPDVINRGIIGDDTYRMLDRIDEVVAAKPKMLCLMAGINDLALYNHSVELTHANILKIMDKVTAGKIKLLVFSTLYVHNRPQVNSLVTDLNKKLQQTCKQRSVAYTDLNAVLGNQGELTKDLTTDGVHLSAKAYKIWGAALSDTLNKMGI